MLHHSIKEPQIKISKTSSGSTILKRESGSTILKKIRHATKENIE